MFGDSTDVFLEFSVRDSKSRKDKAVRFADAQEKCTVDQTESELEAEQHVDIVMYRAYCALKLVMDVLAFCAQSSNWEMLRSLQGQTNSTKEPDAINAMESFQQVTFLSSMR